MAARHPRLFRLAALWTVLAGGCNPGNPAGPSINHAPEIRSVTVVPTRVPIGGTAQVQVVAIDPDGDRLFYKYAAESGTISIPDAANPGQAVYVQNGAARASDKITVTVVDTRDTAATVATSVPLQGNQPPTVFLEWTGAVGTGSCHPPCTVTIAAIAVDPDGDPMTYEWSGCASGTDSTARCRLVAPGSVTASVAVSDGHGGVTTDSVTAVGTNAPPSVRGGQTVRGPQAALRVSSSDPDGDGLECGWSGDCTCTGQQASFDLLCDVPSAAGSCSMTFRCTDIFGASAQTQFTVLP